MVHYVCDLDILLEPGEIGDKLINEAVLNELGACLRRISNAF